MTRIRIPLEGSGIGGKTMIENSGAQPALPHPSYGVLGMRCHLYWDPPTQPGVVLENQVVEDGLKSGPR